MNQPIEGRVNRDGDLEPKAEHFLECFDDALDGQKKREREGERGKEL